METAAPLATAVRTVRVESFGYLHRKPVPTADIIIDVRRWLADPAASTSVLDMDRGDAERRDGRDSCVQRLVYGTPGAVEAVEHVVRAVDAYPADRECVVAFGCAGGLHRSVALVELAAGQLALRGYRVEVEHRDVDGPQVPSARDRNVVVVYSGEQPPEAYEASVFLCGPTPRGSEVDSWRPEAIAEFAARWHGDGVLVVFVPEPRDGASWQDYDAQREWELFWGDRADVVLFWIPRCLRLPGLTTNDEFGRWKDSGRVVLGTPPDAESVRYQREYAIEMRIPVADDLPATIGLALDHIGAGARRVGGHRHVPLLVWRTESFQTWLTTQENAGNELRSGRLEWTDRVGPDRDIVFFWAFHAVVWIAAEQRLKSNEVVMARPDLSSVVAFHRAPQMADCEVVIVREFRTPGRTEDGYVRELPGGSGFTPSGFTAGSPHEYAVGELAEETGIRVDADRIQIHQARQCAATMSTHHQHVFAVELTGEELELARADARVHGVSADTERTFVEVHRFGDLLARRLVDWATLGAIASVLHANIPASLTRSAVSPTGATGETIAA